MYCVILAGGLGTRMRPVTERLPKALVPVLGQPFADIQLAWLAGSGVASVVYCIGYRGAALRDHVGDGSRWGLRVTWVDEGERLRGTAGALRLAIDQGVLPDRFFVLYGDSYLAVDVGAVWEAFATSGAPALMTVYRNDGRWDRSNADYREGKVVRYDKSGKGDELPYIDYGLSALTRAVVKEAVASDGVADLSNLFHDLSLTGRLAGYEVHERFYEVGSPEGLAELEARLGGSNGTR
jgi:NDP-sugar pyrophosphorylase family protein